MREERLDKLEPADSSERRIDSAMAVDRPALRRLASSIRSAKRKGRPFDRNADRFARLLKESVERRADRAEHRVAVSYPEGLPIAGKRADVAALLRSHQVVVVCGETGSGKSTQLPKVLLELGYGVDGVIGHTQPRRIAARGVGVAGGRGAVGGFGGGGGICGSVQRCEWAGDAGAVFDGWFVVGGVGA